MNETRHFVGFFLCLMAVLARIAYVNFLKFITAEIEAQANS